MKDFIMFIIVVLAGIMVLPFSHARAQCSAAKTAKNSSNIEANVNVEPYEDSDTSIIQKTKEYVLQIEELYTGFNHPWGITWYKNSTNIRKEAPIIVSERNGGVWVLVDGKAKFVTGLPKDVYQGGQGGWFDIEQHATESTLFMSYARGKANANVTALISFMLNEGDIFDPNKNIVKAMNVKRLYQMDKKVGSHLHFGGMISIGVDSNKNEVVFLGLGERGQRNLAQSLDNDHGTIQAIALDGAKSHIVAYGVRNAQGMFFDTMRGILYETEHGPKGGDELNIISTNNVHPKNYGWPVVSYGKEYNTGTQVGEGTSKHGMEEPLYYWEISPALSGLSAYYGTQFAKWNGNLFAAALKFQQIYRIVLDNAGTTVLEVETLLNKRLGRIRSIKQYNDDLYFITDQDDGKIFRIRKQ